MEGDWVAVFDRRGTRVHDRAPAGSQLRLLEDRDSETRQATRGKTTVHVAGRLDAPAASPGSPAADMILDLYRSRGRSGLSRLRGRFAGLILDGESGRLLALRDPMGQHPLFYSKVGEKVFFSPSPDRLAGLTGVSPAIDRVTLAEHILHRWPQRERTYLESVSRVPPGHVLSLGPGDDSLHRYWDPAPEGDSDGGSVEGAGTGGESAFGRLFDRAIRRQLGSERTGIFLSGGLDSVSIASRLPELAEAHAGPAPTALSLAMQHPDCDELTAQVGVAERLGFDHEVRPVSAEPGSVGPLGRAATLASGWPFPLLNVWNGEFDRLARAGRARGCDVVLTGSGGDDWLGVTPYLAADLWRAGRLPSLLRLIGTLRNSYCMSAPAAVKMITWTFGLRALARDYGHRLLGRFTPSTLRLARRRRISRAMPTWLAPDPDLRRLLVERADLAEPLGVSSLYVREMRRGLDHALLSLEFEESFELGRRIGIRLAHPFFDPDLVAFLYRIPPEQLVGDGGPDRRLIRDLTSEAFPELGFGSLKKSDARGFFRLAAAREGIELWRALGGPTELARLGIVDARGVEAEIATLMKQERSPGIFRLWDFINTEAWLRGRCA
ncbi:MAG: asparagine synthase-related protein [Thermoanaerobaculia bacterium]